MTLQGDSQNLSMALQKWQEKTKYRVKSYEREQQMPSIPLSAPIPATSSDVSVPEKVIEKVIETMETSPSIIVETSEPRNPNPNPNPVTDSTDLVNNDPYGDEVNLSVDNDDETDTTNTTQLPEEETDAKEDSSSSSHQKIVIDEEKVENMDGEKDGEKMDFKEDVDDSIPPLSITDSTVTAALVDEDLVNESVEVRVRVKVRVRPSQ
jgi:hypothetical protein